MTSREYLELAILEYEKDLEFDKNNQWVKDVLKGLKECQQDLEILEILKEHYDVNFLEVSPNYFVGYSIYEDNKDFKKVKEWLENENTK